MEFVRGLQYRVEYHVLRRVLKCLTLYRDLSEAGWAVNTIRFFVESIVMCLWTLGRSRILLLVALLSFAHGFADIIA